MERINARQVIAPETKLRHREKPGQKHADSKKANVYRFQVKPAKVQFKQRPTVQGPVSKDQRDNNQSRNLEDAQQVAPAQNTNGQERKGEATDQPANLLNHA